MMELWGWVLIKTWIILLIVRINGNKLSATFLYFKWGGGNLRRKVIFIIILAKVKLRNILGMLCIRVLRLGIGDSG